MNISVDNVNAASTVPMAQKLAEIQPLLQVRGLTKLFGPEQGCQKVDFDLYPGEVLGIVGESGSGKSTLLSLLSGRVLPDGGELIYIRGDGEQIDVYDSSEAECGGVSAFKPE